MTTLSARVMNATAAAATAIQTNDVNKILFYANTCVLVVDVERRRRAAAAAAAAVVTVTRCCRSRCCYR